MNRTRTATLVLAILAGGAACSSATSSGQGPAATTVPSTSNATSGPTETGLKASITAYTAAILRGDAKSAFALVSDRCQRQLGYQTYKQLVHELAAIYGPTVPIKTISVTSLNGTHARASYTFDVTKLDKSNQPWTFEGATWRFDKC